MDNITATGNNFAVENVADFDLIDSINETDFEHFIDLLKGDNVDPFVELYDHPNYDSENIAAGCFDIDSQFVVPNDEDFFDFNLADIDPDFACNALPANIREGDDQEENAEVQSSATIRTGTNTSTRSKKGAKADRPRIIMSEQRRRGRMKEKLYALRALVPNITKMDKASIIGDAVLYVQDLQMQAEKLKTEIAGLESSMTTETNSYQQGSSQDVNGTNFTYNYPVMKKIMQIDVFQLEEGGFCVRVVSNKGSGVAVSLYKALESFSSFNIQSSNLAIAAEDYVLTFTVNVKACKGDMDLPSLKFWIASAFLNQGFDFETTLSASV